MTTLKQITQGQINKESVINENFDALSHGAVFLFRGNQSGLNYNYYGGEWQLNDGTTATFTDGSLTLTDNATNYIFFNNTTNILDKNTTGFENGNHPIAIAITSGGVITAKPQVKKVQAVYAKGTRGDLQAVVPTMTGSVIGGAKLGTGLKITTDVLAVDIDTTNLKNVNITTPTDGQVIAYDTVTSKFINKTINTGNKITVSTTSPSNPSLNDIWIQI